MKKNYINPNMKVVELKSLRPLLTVSYSSEEASSVAITLGREDDFSDEDFQ